MTAREEINLWIAQGKKITDENEQEKFLKEIREQLNNKNEEEQKENLMALKGAVHDFGKRVDEAVKKSEIKVYPSSKEEIELLKSLFQKMNIRFELG